MLFSCNRMFCLQKSALYFTFSHCNRITPMSSVCREGFSAGYRGLTNEASSTGYSPEPKKSENCLKSMWLNGPFCFCSLIITKLFNFCQDSVKFLLENIFFRSTYLCPNLYQKGWQR